jgi:hypothetical protein
LYCPILKFPSNYLYVLFIFLSKKSDYGVNPNKRRVPGSCYITFNRNISQSKHEYYWPCVQNSVTRSFNNGTETRVHLRLLSSIRKTSSKKRSIRKTSSKKRSIIPLLNFFFLTTQVQAVLPHRSRDNVYRSIRLSEPKGQHGRRSHATSVYLNRFRIQMFAVKRHSPRSIIVRQWSQGEWKTAADVNIRQARVIKASKRLRSRGLKGTQITHPTRPLS